jgi:hypothetical protein
MGVMPCSYRIDLENRVVRCRAWGVFTHAEATAARGRFTSDPAFRADFSQIYDFIDTERIDMTADQIRELGRNSPFGPAARRAAVAPRAAIYGALRMFAIQHEASGGKTNIEVFRTASEAEAWLGLPADTRVDPD